MPPRNPCLLVSSPCSSRLADSETSDKDSDDDKDSDSEEDSEDEERSVGKVSGRSVGR